MYKNYDEKEIKRYLKKHIIEDDEDFTMKEQKMIESLVQSKITNLNHEENGDNQLCHTFIGSFLELWQNLEFFQSNQEFPGQMFPENHKQLGLMQISQLQEGILKKEGVDN